jgi:hypothetical protein
MTRRIVSTALFLVACSAGTGPAGPIGPAGKEGAIGPAGAPGVTGPTGTAGPQGGQGPMGVDGPLGPTGPTGDIGPLGPTGPTGATGPAGAVAVSGQNVVRINDVIIQWGTVTLNTSGQTNYYATSITFPVAFTQAPSVSFSMGDTGPWASEPVLTTSGLGATGVTVELCSHTYGDTGVTAMTSPAAPLTWMAIGR